MLRLITSHAHQLHPSWTHHIIGSPISPNGQDNAVIVAPVTTETSGADTESPTVNYGTVMLPGEPIWATHPGAGSGRPRPAMASLASGGLPAHDPARAADGPDPVGRFDFTNPAARPYAARAEGVGDHRQIDALLQKGPGCRRDGAEGCRHHRHETQEHPGDDPLTCDPHRATADRHRVREPIEPIDHHHRVGGLGCDGRPGRRRASDSVIGPRRSDRLRPRVQLLRRPRVDLRSRATPDEYQRRGAG